MTAESSNLVPFFETEVSGVLPPILRSMLVIHLAQWLTLLVIRMARLCSMAMVIRWETWSNFTGAQHVQKRSNWMQGCNLDGELLFLSSIFSFYCYMPNLSPLDAEMMLATTMATTGGTVGMTASSRGCLSSRHHLDTTSPHSGIELAHL
jgi:hypothetical protein